MPTRTPRQVTQSGVYPIAGTASLLPPLSQWTRKAANGSYSHKPGGAGNVVYLLIAYDMKGVKGFVVYVAESPRDASFKLIRWVGRSGPKHPDAPLPTSDLFANAEDARLAAERDYAESAVRGNPSRGGSDAFDDAPYALILSFRDGRDMDAAARILEGEDFAGDRYESDRNDLVLQFRYDSRADLDSAAAVLERKNARRPQPMRFTSRVEERRGNPASGASRAPLPFPVVYTAVGVLTKGKDYGQRLRVSKDELSRAIQIATSSRQKQGLLGAGTRDLTRQGKAWERDMRAREPLTVAAAEEEFERLVDLTKARPKKKPRPKKKGTSPGKPRARGGSR